MKRSSLLYISDVILEVEDKLSKRRDFDFATFIHHKCLRYDIEESECEILKLINKCLKRNND